VYQVGANVLANSESILSDPMLQISGAETLMAGM